MKIALVLTFILNLIHCFSQGTGYDYCADNFQKDTLIGKKVKIYQGRMTFDPIDFALYGITDSSLIDKLTNHRPHKERIQLLETGAIGEIIYVSNKPVRFYEEDGSGSIQEKFYVIKIENDYFPVACEWIIDVSEPDNSDLNKKWNQLYQAYPNDCIVKSEDDWIDNRSSYFACELINKNVDTLLYSRYMIEGYSRVNHGTIVMWYDNGQGYIKSFHDEGIQFPVRESENYPFNWDVLLTNYTQNVDEFTGVVGKEDDRAFYEVQLFIPEKNYEGKGFYDKRAETTIHFKLNESSEMNFYYYLESIFKILE